MKGLLGRIAEFFNDVKNELKKVSYPSRAQTIGSTTVVLFLVLMIGIYLSLIDLGLVKAVKVIIQ